VTRAQTSATLSAGDVTRDNAAIYGEVEATWVAPSETRLFDRFLTASMSVLEVGCGTGRITRELIRRGVRVSACDVNALAVESLRASLRPGPQTVIDVADARQLPYNPDSFDAVVFSFNGLDFIYPTADRFRAVAEIARVLRPGGVFIFSSHNPLGTLLSLGGLRSVRGIRWRLDYAVSGSFLRQYFRDGTNVLLYQALPHRVIRDVLQAAPFAFEIAMNKSGTTGRLWLLTLSSSWPYYVFRKVAEHADRS
jgi:SAM-dependent methyltransferase